MKLSLMKRFYDTVDEDKKSPVLDLMASCWFESADTWIIRASANFVAKVQADQTYYLRFNHETERSIDHIQNELAYIQHLVSKGINANKPVHSRSGNLIEIVESELGTFHAVLFEEIKGKHIESDELDLDGYKRWGAALASIHNASHGLDLKAQTWVDQLGLLESLSPESPILSKEIGSVKDKLINFSRENYGLIVFDFEMDNIKWDGTILGFMDFDDYCINWYAADIAYALRDLYDDQASNFNPEDKRYLAFIDGYRGVRPISDEELDLIPVLVRLHNLYFYARIHRANTGSTIIDPEWVVRLSKRLEEINESYLKDFEKNPIS